MVIEVGPLNLSHCWVQLEPWKISNLYFKGHFRDFFPDPLACFPCWCKAQLLTQVCNCSQRNHGSGYRWTAAWPRHCLAWQTRSHSGQCSSGWGDSQFRPSLDDNGRECFATNLRFQDPSLAEPTWASGKYKSMSWPVTSWAELGALLDPRRTSDTSQKVPCDASVGFSGYIPCIKPW